MNLIPSVMTNTVDTTFILQQSTPNGQIVEEAVRDAHDEMSEYNYTATKYLQQQGSTFLSAQEKVL